MNKEQNKLSKKLIKKLNSNKGIIYSNEINDFFKEYDTKDRTIVIKYLKDNNKIEKDQNAIFLKTSDKLISDRQWEFIKLIITGIITFLIGYFLSPCK